MAEKNVPTIENDKNKDGKNGDLGGYAEHSWNGSGNGWVSGDARAYDNALVSGEAWLKSNTVNRSND